jgi:hypothetical protein
MVSCNNTCDYASGTVPVQAPDRGECKSNKKRKIVPWVKKQFVAQAMYMAADAANNWTLKLSNWEMNRLEAQNE